MRVRYRKLTRHWDPKAYQETLDAEHRDITGGAYGRRGPLGLVAIAESPRAVEVDEESAELDEVRQLVERRKLRPTDLVDTGKGWQLVSECAELFEACESARIRIARLRIAWIVGAMLFTGVASFALILALR